MIKGLDGLRAIAFLLVFFFHCQIIPFGWAGVQIFFVLSGYLIIPILIKSKNTPARNYYSRFIIRRGFRIFPLYYFFLLFWSAIVGLSFWLYGPSELSTAFLNQAPYAFSYFYNFSELSPSYSEFLPFAHLWSLSVEEQFYLLIPLLILVTPSRHLKNVLILIIISGPLVRALSMLYFQEHFLSTTSHNIEIQEKVNSIVYKIPWSHFDAFSIGGLFAIIKLPKAKTQLYLAMTLVIFFGVAGQIYNNNFNIYSLGYELHLNGSFLQPIWGYSLLNYLFALIIYLVAKEQMWNRTLENSRLKSLGKISYGAYVYHYPIILIISLGAQNLINSGYSFILVFPAAVLSAFGLTILISLASFKFIEQPFMTFRNNHF